MDLAKKLMDYAEDPMWADHAEVPKVLLAKAAVALSTKVSLKPLVWSTPGITGWSHARGLFSLWSAGPWQGRFATTGNGSSPSGAYDSLEKAQAAIEKTYQEYAQPFLEQVSTPEEVRVKEALTPSADTKAAYMGEFSIGVRLSVDGQEDHRSIDVPWTTIKEIMAAIRTRAGIV